MLKIKNLKHRKLNEWLFVLSMNGIDGALGPIIYATWNNVQNENVIEFCMYGWCSWHFFDSTAFAPCFIRLPQSCLYSTNYVGVTIPPSSSHWYPRLFEANASYYTDRFTISPKIRGWHELGRGGGMKLCPCPGQRNTHNNHWDTQYSTNMTKCTPQWQGKRVFENSLF